MRYRILILVLWFGRLAQAQDDPMVELSHRLGESRTRFPAVRPLVFFSQDKYTPGDTAFFRLFVLTETERILADRSLVTLELLNPKGVVSARQMISSQRFGAANQLVLPDSLSPGFYEVRFFTDRMTLAYGQTAPLMIVGEKRLEPLPPTGTELTAYPEGGHVIPRALNRVVVRAKGKVPQAASLYGGDGKISSFGFDDSGFASIQFIPEQGLNYWIEYKVDGKIYHYPLPDGEMNAMTIRVYRGPRQTWVLDMATGSSGLSSAFLVLMVGRQLYHAQEVLFSGNRSNILAANDFFPEGFSELFLVNKEMNVLSYRPVYVPISPKGTIAISNLPESLPTRQNVDVRLTVTSDTGLPLASGLAIAIIPDEVRMRNLRTPDPTLELRPSPPRFDWTMPISRIDQEVLTYPVPSTIVPDYPLLIHNSNLAISGKVFSRDATQPIPYLSRIVIYLQEDHIQYETAIDGTGNFNLEKIYDFMGSDKVFAKVIHNGQLVSNVSVNWTVNPGEVLPLQTTRYVETNENEAYGVLRKKKRTIDRSYTFFLGDEKPAKGVVDFNTALLDRFQDADITVKPGEYVTFETMREMILEIIPSLKFRYRGGDSVVHVDLNNHSPFVQMRYAEGPPLYVIDGYMTTDTRYLMSISPRDVLSVKIINEVGKLNRLQNLAKDGVVFVQTRIPEETRSHLGQELHAIEGLSPTLLPKTSAPAGPRVPDLRSLLYWSPLTEGDSTGIAKFSFRTSDLPGTYWIRIVGTTAAGHLVTTEQRFVVNFK